MPISVTQFWAELDKLGEQAVRLKVAKGVYGARKLKLVKEWLRRQNTPGEATPGQGAKGVSPMGKSLWSLDGWRTITALVLFVFAAIALFMRMGQTDFGYQILGRDPPNRTQSTQSSTPLGDHVASQPVDQQTTPAAPTLDANAGELPAPTVQAAGEETPEARRLAQEVASLQRELDATRAQLADKARSSLDPQSELGGLVRQLEADNTAARNNAATGLFVIHDVRAAQALMDYYWKSPGEAIQINGHYSYIQFAWDLDKQLASDFAVKMLASSLMDATSEAFRFIGNVGDRERRDFDVWFTAKLEDVALRNSDTLARTRAKSLLERRTQLRQRMDKEGRKFEEGP